MTSSMAGAASRSAACALTRWRTAHRTIALQRALADHPHVAQATLAHNLVKRLWFDHRAITLLDLQARTCGDDLARFGDGAIKECRAWVELAELCEAWDERMPTIRQLVALACCMARRGSERLAGAVLGPHAQRGAVVADPAPGRHRDTCGLDMSAWWEPTAAYYLQPVSKAVILKAVEEAVSAEMAASCAGLKKGELVAKAEVLRAGT